METKGNIPGASGIYISDVRKLDTERITAKSRGVGLVTTCQNAPRIDPFIYLNISTDSPSNAEASSFRTNNKLNAPTPGLETIFKSLIRRESHAYKKK